MVGATFIVNLPFHESFLQGMASSWLPRDWTDSITLRDSLSPYGSYGNTHIGDSALPTADTLDIEMHIYL